MRFIRWILDSLTAPLADWALREIHPLHPDVPDLVLKQAARRARLKNYWRT